MYPCFDEAVQAGLKAYRMLEYADSCRSAFRVASKEFKEYLKDIGLPYSTELAQQWLSDSKEHWNGHKVKSSIKAMSILADIMEHDCATTSLKTKVERTPPFTRLPNWSRTLLDSYLTTVASTYGAPYVIQIRNACSRFFLFLELAGKNQPSEITYDIVKSFFAKDVHASAKCRVRYNNEVCRCLLYMADRGLIPETVGLLLNKFISPGLIIVTELPEADRNRFLRFFDPTDREISRAKMEYDKGVKQLIDIHKNQRYTSSILKSDSRAVRDFRDFMDANLLAYSNALALEWLEFQRSKWSQAKYLASRKVLLNINDILCTGTLSTTHFSTKEPKYSLSGWGDDLLSQYLLERKREGCVVSTLTMIRNSCSRFIVFLDHHGIANEKGITPEIIKEFQAQDKHSTVEGRNAYAIKIRGFLRYLAEKRLVPETLELAVSTEMAPRTSIVTTLSDQQIDAIYAFRQNADRPIALRSAAIIMLGLRMGLRASDIANLKLTDISWKENSISIVQQKTGVHLKLPLPVDAGNSLYRYLCEGRPQCNSPHVFVRHRAPYCRVNRSICGRLLSTVFSKTLFDTSIIKLI